MENTCGCVLGLGLELSFPWPREGLSSERLSLALASDFFYALGLGLGFFLCPWPCALCPRLHICLHTRHQYVSYQNKRSESQINRFGVSKNSNLGPLLFLIYINDLRSAINSVPRIFADDTCLLIHSPSTSTIAKNINSELLHVHNCTVANKVTVNLEESLALIIPPKIATSIPDIHININYNSVTLKDSGKYLGITIDSKLNFDVHIDSLTRKIARSVVITLGVITKLKQRPQGSANFIGLYLSSATHP